MTVAIDTRSRWHRLLPWVAGLAVALAAAALILLALVPLGWHAGLWHFRVSLTMLMPWVAYLAIAGIVVALVSLVGWRRLGLVSRVLALLALIGAGSALAMPWHYNQLRGARPPIHDISTDLAEPPSFVTLLPVRQAAKANGLERPPEVTKAQQTAYGDIVSLDVPQAPAQAFDLALGVAQAMPRWQLAASDPASGRIEASEASRWMGFVDDVVIRVRPFGQGSRIDIRSVSRVGRSDLGVNAERVRAYLAAVKTRLG